MDYKVIHKGYGKFDVITEDGIIKEAGPNLRGMIRYTFFEDYTFPPIGWETTRLDLLKAYHSKLFKDISEGKIKLNEKNNNNPDYIN